MHPFLKTIDTFINEQELLVPDATYLVALSGGADSVCLLRVLIALGYSVEAIHCNFHLRGSESDRDEEFCRTLTEGLGIKLHVVHFDTRSYARTRKISVEMAARELRYKRFGELLEERNLAGVVVAHHRNDAIETFFLNLVRGTGIEGLKGIKSKNGYILRPLLSVTRQEIEAYLEELRQDYVTDSSNNVDDVQRNVVRLRLMPILRALNPKAGEHIVKTISQVADSLALLRHAIEVARARIAYDHGEETIVSIHALMREVSPATLLWEVLKDKGFSSAEAEHIFHHLNVQTGKMWYSRTHSLVVDRGRLLIVPLRTEDNRDHPLSITLCDVDNDFLVIKEKTRVSLDADKVKFPIGVRRVRRADWFVPFGMEGRKLLSKFLAEQRVPRSEKHRTLVVTDAEDNIMWVVGHRADNRFRITESTTHAMIISINLP